MPELLDDATDDWAAPDDGIRRVLEQEIHADDLDAIGRAHRISTGLIAADLALRAEHLRNGWARDVCVEDARVLALAAHGHSHEARDERFADAALAADDGDDVADRAELIRRLVEILLARILAAGRPAGAAVMVACFCHSDTSRLYRLVFLNLSR